MENKGHVWVCSETGIGGWGSVYTPYKNQQNGVETVGDLWQYKCKGGPSYVISSKTIQNYKLTQQCIKPSLVHFRKLQLLFWNLFQDRNQQS